MRGPQKYCYYIVGGVYRSLTSNGSMHHIIMAPKHISRNKLDALLLVYILSFCIMNIMLCVYDIRNEDEEVVKDKNGSGTTGKYSTSKFLFDLREPMTP